MTLLRWLRYSLTARLLLLFLAAAMALALIFSLTLGAAASHQFRSTIRPHVVQYLDYVREDLGQPPDPERARALSRRVPVDIHIRGPGLDWSSTGRPLDLEGMVLRERRGPRGGRIAFSERGERFILRSLSGDYQLFFELRRPTRTERGLWIGLLALAAMLLVVYLCYRGIRRLFHPVSDIQQGVQHFAAGDLDYRIPLRRRDELGELGRSINAMAGEIRRMLDAKRQLLLALSHELRSPLTRARVSLELLDESPPRQALIGDLTEMQRLIEELLEAERLSGRHAALHREPLALNELLKAVLDDYFPDRPTRFEPVSGDPWVLLDAARVRLLLKNLLANAWRHSPPDRPPPELGANIDGTLLLLTVTDHGEGIAAEHLPHLSEPFYRVDPARQRTTGGYGLGLYLCRLIAEAHGGQLTITSWPGQGTAVTVTLELKSVV